MTILVYLSTLQPQKQEESSLPMKLSKISKHH